MATVLKTVRLPGRSCRLARAAILWDWNSTSSHLVERNLTPSTPSRSPLSSSLTSSAVISRLREGMVLTQSLLLSTLLVTARKVPGRIW